MGPKSPDGEAVLIQPPNKKNLALTGSDSDTMDNNNNLKSHPTEDDSSINFKGLSQPPAPSRANKVRKLQIDNSFDSDDQQQQQMNPGSMAEHHLNDMDQNSDQSPVLLKQPPAIKSRQARVNKFATE
jgi:hypothetical protein